MDNKIYEDVTLSISSKNMKCDNIYKLLIKLGINSSISENKSIQCLDGNCWLENGCQLFLPKISKKNLYENIWLQCKKDYNLNCAHLNIPQKFNGCIKDFNRLKGCK